MTLVVQQYGSASLGTLSRIASVADRVLRTRRHGPQVVAVVTAMLGVSDDLLKHAYTLSQTPSPRELDRLLSTGEMASGALLAMALQARGCPALALTGHQAGIVTDDRHTAAHIQAIDPSSIRRALNQGTTPVVAGLQGENAAQDITTFGPGGAELTAVALAARLHADRCELYQDMDDTANENPFHGAAAPGRSAISYDEMLGIIHAGASTLPARAVRLAQRYAVPMVVKSWCHEGLGTYISGMRPTSNPSTPLKIAG